MPRMTIATTITIEEDSPEGYSQMQALAATLAQTLAGYGRISINQDDGILEPIPTEPEPTLGSSPFTRSMMWEWWRWVRGNKAGKIVATVAAASTRQQDLMRDLGNLDGPTFGGYLSSLGHAVTGLKLPSHPLLKAWIDEEMWYMFDPAVAEVLKEFAQRDGYYHDLTEE